MTEHPDLLGLLRGELTNRVAADSGEHLDGCPQCRTELAELATAHAMLSRSGRVLGSLAAPRLDDPPPLRLPARARRRPVLGLVAAAAAVVGLVAGGGALLARDRAPRAPAGQVSAELTPLEGTGAGRVLMHADGAHSTHMTITTRGLPTVRTGQFLEAWLLDPRTDKMLPLGQLGPRGEASFEISDALLDRYSAIDVSLEKDDGDPQHSVTSVLRATYAAGPATTS